MTAAPAAAAASEKQGSQAERASTPPQALPRDLVVCSAVVFASSLLAGMVGPFQSKAINKDLSTAAFTGTIFSVTGLLGALLLSRFSDRLSRKRSLCAAYAGMLVASGLSWVLPGALVPLFIASFCGAGAASIFRAMIGDYSIASGASTAAITRWLGLQQLLAALAFAIASGLGPRFASTLSEINFIALLGYCLLFPLLALLGEPPARAAREAWSLRGFLDVRIARTPAGLFSLAWTFAMVFIYHVCQTLLGPLVQERFSPDIAMLGHLQAVGGIGVMVGTLLSGPIASYTCRPHPTKLLSSFMLVTFVARCTMFATLNWSTYTMATFTISVMGIGVVGPVRQGIVPQFVPPEELGGFYGAQQAVENLSGIVGPAVAALIGLPLSPSPLALLVFAIYAATPICALFGYPRFLQPLVEKRWEERKAKQE